MKINNKIYKLKPMFFMAFTNKPTRFSVYNIQPYYYEWWFKFI